MQMGVLNIFKKKSVELMSNNQPVSGIDLSAEKGKSFAYYSALASPKVAGANFITLYRTVPEVFFPIDYIASRIAGAKFVLKKFADDSIVWENKQFNNILSHPNCLMSWREFVYNHHIYKLATGNAYVRAAMANMLKGEKWKWCDNFWVLPADMVDCQPKNGLVPMFGMAKKEDLIDYYSLKYGDYQNLRIDINEIWHDRDGYIKFNGNSTFLKSESRMCSVLKPISNLLAVYEARNVIYVKRGGLGFIVSKKEDATGSVAMTDKEKKEIIDQHFGKYGVGYGQLPYGLSDIPLGFVRTNLSISELQPFDETLYDAISIAGAYGIPAVLVPRKDQSTFSNQATAEKSVYCSTIIPMTKQFCNDLTSFLGYDKSGYYIDCDFTDIDCLQVGMNEAEKVKTLTNDRCCKQFSCGLITLNDWRAQIGESKVENPLYDKLKFEMSEEELNIIDRVFNTKSGDDNGRTNEKPSVQNEGE